MTMSDAVSAVIHTQWIDGQISSKSIQLLSHCDHVSQGQESGPQVSGPSLRMRTVHLDDNKNHVMF